MSRRPPVPRSVPTYRRRALTALAFLGGFYVLVASVVVGIGVVVVASVQMGRFRPQLLGAVLAAVVLLRAVVALDRGGDDDELSVAADGHPRLRAAVEEVCAAMGTTPPDEIRVVAGVDAHVFQRGRLLGLAPGRTTLVLGLSLMATLSVDELRAVVAHEIGHLHRGDTRLGGVVYRARLSIERAAAGLTGPLGAVFAAYERAFLRSTMRVARAQEEAADAASIAVAGPVATAEALVRTTTAGLAYAWYLSHYVTPVLRAGRWPADLVGGFRRMVENPRRAEELAALQAALAVEEPSPYDSHPPVTERVATALAASVSAPEPSPRVPARSLLDAPERLELDAAAAIGIASTGDPEAGITWERVAGEVWLPELDEHAEAVLAATAWLLAFVPDVVDDHDLVGGRDSVDEHDLVGDRDLVDDELPAAAAEDLLALLDRNREHQLVPLLDPAFLALDGIEREAAAPGILEEALFAVLGHALVHRHGCRWEMIDGGPLVLIDPSGFLIDLERLATLALDGPDGRGLVGDAIAEAGSR